MTSSDQPSLHIPITFRALPLAPPCSSAHHPFPVRGTQTTHQPQSKPTPIEINVGLKLRPIAAATRFASTPRITPRSGHIVCEAQDTAVEEWA